MEFIKLPLPLNEARVIARFRKKNNNEIFLSIRKGTLAAPKLNAKLYIHFVG
jgi:hypothetical protein